MLNGIHLVDFGNHRNTRLTFGRMTALVGQNGSGKTTVMRAVEEAELAINNSAKKQTENAFIRRKMTRAVVTASWTMFEGQTRIDWGLRLADSKELFTRRWPEGSHPIIWIPDPKPALQGAPVRMAMEEIRKQLEKGELTPTLTKPIEAGRIEKVNDWEYPPSWSCRYFKTSSRSLQSPAAAIQELPSINHDGSNLAWALSYLMTAEPERFAQIVAALKEVVPVVRRIRSKPIKLTRLVKQFVTINKQERAFDEEREVMGQELIFDMKSGDGLPATSVSEGTLVVLAVLTLVYGSDADLIMLDDVELGLHPKAQRDLIRQLRRIQETHPQLQIIVSTHSPYVVDEFKAEDVWVFAPDKEGCAVAKRLSEHPDAKRALEVLTTGEFWSAEGEPWVLDETPAARVAEEPGA